MPPAAIAALPVSGLGNIYYGFLSNALVGSAPAQKQQEAAGDVPGIMLWSDLAGGAASPAVPAAPSGTAALPPAEVKADTVSAAAEPPALPYQIYVSKNTYTVAILGLDDSGQYTKLVKLFSAATGKTSAQTRAGTYTVTGKERWHRWTDTYYSPYATKHSGGLYFHGPNYSAKIANAMIASTYNQIGTSSSSGCLRSTVDGAKWIYDNCPIGTVITIANDSLYTAERPALLPLTQNYDPSDPDAIQ